MSDKSRSTELAAVTRLFFKNILFTLVIAVAFLPTLIAKRIIYGSALNFGYGGLWNFASPALLKVCLSSEHGLFSWTPILALAVIGLFFLRRHDKFLSLYSIAAFAAYLYTIGCYLDWAGVSSFGNRFFVSLTPLFILGLAAFFEWMSLSLRERPANILAISATSLLIVWNLGLIFQWGTHLIPARGLIVLAYPVFTQSSSWCVRGESLSNPGSIFDRTRTLDEPHRAARSAAVETTRQESSKPAARERQRVKVLARSGT